MYRRPIRTNDALYRIKSSRDAPRPANGAADYNPLALGRKAPSNKRIERTPNRMNKFIRPGDAHPQRR